MKLTIGKNGDYVSFTAAYADRDNRQNNLADFHQISDTIEPHQVTTTSGWFSKLLRFFIPR